MELRLRPLQLRALRPVWKTDEGLEAASGLAAGLAEPADDGLEAAAGLVMRVSVLAVLIGLNGLATSGAVFLGAGASFAFFSEAGLNALGVPAGL